MYLLSRKMGELAFAPLAALARLELLRRLTCGIFARLPDNLILKRIHRQVKSHNRDVMEPIGKRPLDSVTDTRRGGHKAGETAGSSKNSAKPQDRICGLGRILPREVEARLELVRIQSSVPLPA